MTVDNHIRPVAIYKPDLGTVKGKTVRFKSNHVRTDVIVPVPAVILELHGLITLCVDIFFIDNHIFVGNISRKVKFIMGEGKKEKKYFRS